MIRFFEKHWHNYVGNLIIAVASCLFTVCGMAQSETQASKSVSAVFEKHYNARAYDSVFAMFADVMKKALPIEKTNEVLTSLYQQLGLIKSREFLRYEQTYASYKTQFEKDVVLINISVDEQAKINGLLVKPYTESKTPAPTRNATKASLPFKGEWTVLWGGDTKEQNYHVQHPAQKNAFDILIKDARGNSYKSTGKANEDYYAFGKELLTPCDGEVVMAVDGIKDNIPGEMNPTFLTGNTVIIKTTANEFLFLCHFKQGSVAVKQGQKVKAGQLLGLCGNSGNSSEPHLHFHIQNVEDMTKATGIKCFFETLMVNGTKKSDYSPVQSDKISQL